MNIIGNDCMNIILNYKKSIEDYENEIKNI